MQLFNYDPLLAEENQLLFMCFYLRQFSKVNRGWLQRRFEVVRGGKGPESLRVFL